MGYTPADILDYILENELEADFMVSLAHHVGDYTIAEITDGVFKEKDGEFKLKSATYKINLPIDDDEIKAALRVGAYVSAFISRFNNIFQVHFFIHGFMAEDKALHEEEILKAVIQYMIFKTVIALRLDTPDKVKKYIGKN